MASTKSDRVLLVTGVGLILVPLVLAMLRPEIVGVVEFYLRTVAALGGGLVGASIPGLLQVKLPFAKAGGALAVFLLIYAVNPARVAERLHEPDSTTALPDVATEWVAAAEAARASGALDSARPAPPEFLRARTAFEVAWNNARGAERQSLDRKLAYDALSMLVRTYRVSEIQSESKATSNKWADAAIAHFEDANDSRFLVESLLEKAAVFLELSQIEHTDPAAWGLVAKQGDAVMSRACTLASDSQRAECFRMWSRFYYNLSRPRDGNLAENWDNNYLFVALDKSRQAFELDQSNIKNATQFARTLQKTAANPPQNTDPEWTVRLRSMQTTIRSAWESNESNLRAPLDRVPALNILGVITMDAVRREWELLDDAARKERAAEMISELQNVAIRHQREALALIPNTELEENYDFDLYYDLARIQAVKCQIATFVGNANAPSECAEIAVNLAKARSGATAVQLTNATSSLKSDPTLSETPQPYLTQMSNALLGALTELR